MDEYSLAQKQQKENRGLMFLEVGIFEIFFVGIILILLFGILNYFNILRLSEVFPNQLGFLPHRAYQQLSNSTMKQSNNNSNPIIVPPSNYTPKVFQYDAEKAKTILTQYIKENIKSEFLPSKIEVKHKLIYSGIIVLKIPYFYTASDIKRVLNNFLQNIGFSSVPQSTIIVEETALELKSNLLPPPHSILTIDKLS